MSHELAKFAVPIRIASISTASTEQFVVPENCALVEVHGVLGGTISGANAAVTVTGGGSTAATLTVPFSGSAAGDVVSSTELTRIVTKGSVVSVATNGASTGAQSYTVTLVFDRRYG
jgi:hypothetical protein